MAPRCIVFLLAAATLGLVASEAPGQTHEDGVQASETPPPAQQQQSADLGAAAGDFAAGVTGGSGGGGSPPEVPDAAHRAASATTEPAKNATEQAKKDLAAVAFALANATEALAASGASSGSLRGAAAWGHGAVGETCCMCSEHRGLNTVLYAAADYSHWIGIHGATWWCNFECESKCRQHGGHMFGCYDERHLQEMDRQYGHRSGYQILHQDHYGSIC